MGSNSLRGNFVNQAYYLGGLDQAPAATVMRIISVIA